MATVPVKVPAVEWKLQVSQVPKRNNKKKNTTFMKCRMGENHFTTVEWDHIHHGFSKQTLENLARIVKLYRNHQLDGLPIPEDELSITINGNAEFAATHYKGSTKLKSRITIKSVKRQDIDPNAYKPTDGLDLEWGLEFEPIEVKAEGVTNELKDAQKKMAELENQKKREQLAIQVQHQADMLEKLEAQHAGRRKGKGTELTPLPGDMPINDNGKRAPITEQWMMDDSDVSMSDEDELFKETLAKLGETQKSKNSKEKGKSSTSSSKGKSSSKDSSSKDSSSKSNNVEETEGEYEVSVGTSASASGKKKKSSSKSKKTDESSNNTTGDEPSSSASAPMEIS